MAVEIRIEGLQDAMAALRGLPDKLRKRALRNAIGAAARVVRDAARKAAPVISATSPMVIKGWRKPKTLRNAIMVRTSKVSTRQGNVGVFVNVRPAKGAKYRGGKLVSASKRGTKSPDDPYYWRWLEFGRKGRKGSPGARKSRERRSVGPIKAMRFMQGAATKLGEALTAFNASILPQIAKLNSRPKVDL